MPNLLDLYKQYNQILIAKEKAFAILREKQEAIMPFLDDLRLTFENIQSLNAQIGLLLDTCTRKREKIATLKKLDTNPENQTAIDKLEAEYKLTLEELTKKDAELALLVKSNHPWLDPETPFDISHIRDKVDAKAFKEYMDALAYAQLLEQATIDQKGIVNRGVLLFPDEVKQAQEWSLKYNKPLSEKLAPQKEDLVPMRIDRLDRKYQATQRPDLIEFNEKRYEILKNEEKLTPKEILRLHKQIKYRSMLPEYVTKHLPIEANIKGERFAGIGRAKTGEHIREIQVFLNKEFDPKEKEKDLAKIQNLFKKVRIDLSKEQIADIYNNATSMKSKLEKKDQQSTATPSSFGRVVASPTTPSAPPTKHSESPAGRRTAEILRDFKAANEKHASQSLAQRTPTIEESAATASSRSALESAQRESIEYEPVQRISIPALGLRTALQAGSPVKLVGLGERPALRYSGKS